MNNRKYYTNKQQSEKIKSKLPDEIEKINHEFAIFLENDKMKEYEVTYMVYDKEYTTILKARNIEEINRYISMWTNWDAIILIKEELTS